MLTFIDYKTFYPKLQLLIDNYDIIRKEYDDNKDKLLWKLMHWDAGYSTEGSPKDIGWRTAPLFFNKNFFDNSEYLPTLINIIKEIKTTHRGGLLSLNPHCELPWHKDYDEPNKDGNLVIRLLWGLDVPVEEDKVSFIEVENEKRIFKNNELYIFSSLSNHRVVNEMSKERIVFGFDIICKIKKN